MGVPSDAVTLRSGPLGLVVAPRAGGSIARFWSEGTGRVVDLLRPASAAAVAAADPWGMASFPLVPWSNRIREGRFAFGGRQVSLGAAWPAERHAIHGLGFRVAWAVMDAGPEAVSLEHCHRPDEWPWAYRARQRVALSPLGLHLTLAVTNEGVAAMPLGIGWHPYFPRTPETTLAARVRGLWLTDAEVLPTELIAPPPERDPARGLPVARVALDNVFTGWDGHAVVRWPERRLRLTIAAAPPLRCLVVYTPPTEPFFCAEPVSQVIDAFNLHAAGRSDTGVLTVAPGETVEAGLTLVPEVE
jgi:aldose 1-epimerase